MFELNENIEVSIKTIGPQNKKIIIADNFYKNPNEVRNLAINLDSTKDPALTHSLPGSRIFQRNSQIRENLKPFFDNYCLNNSIWNKNIDEEMYESQWDNVGFMCNVLNYDSVVENTWKSIPHQDFYKDTIPVNENNQAFLVGSENEEEIEDYPQFGVVIYLNTPDECAGGTNLFSYNGKMTLPRNVLNYIVNDLPDDFRMLERKEQIYPTIMKWLNSDMQWKVEYQSEMVYNRCIFYESDTLHSHNIQPGMFTNYNRLNQVFFL